MKLLTYYHNAYILYCDIIYHDIDITSIYYSQVLDHRQYFIHSKYTAIIQSVCELVCKSDSIQKNTTALHNANE